MAERVSLELDGGGTVEWDLASLLRAADAADAAAEPAWELAGEPDWERLEWLRVISASFGETGLAMVVSRPAGAATPDSDAVTVVYLAPTGPEAADEAFVSTEYDSEGRVRRIGVELWPQIGGARRIAADRSGDPVVAEAGGIRRETTPMAFRLDGERGSGLHELVRRA